MENASIQGDDVLGIPVQDGNVGRLWTHLLHGTHQITPINGIIVPEEELRADWTAIEQPKTEWMARKQQERQTETQ